MNFKLKLLDLMQKLNQKKKDKENNLDNNNQNKWIQKKEKEFYKNNIKKKQLEERK